MRRILLLIVLLLVGFAPVPFPKPKSRETDSTKKDLKAMQGEWTERFADSASITIVGDRMVYSSEYAWKLTLNAKTTPRRIEAIGVGPRLVGKVRRGIYRLEKDKITICWRRESVGKPDWPVSFDYGKKGGWLEVFTPVKP